MGSKLKIFENNYTFLESIANLGNTYLYLDNLLAELI